MFDVIEMHVVGMSHFVLGNQLASPLPHMAG